MARDPLEAARVLFRMCTLVTPSLTELDVWFSNYTKTLEKWAREEGNQGVKRFKEIAGLARRICFHDRQWSVPDEERLPYVKSSKKGIPSLVEPVVEYYFSHKSQKWGEEDARLTGSIFSLLRVHELYLGQVTDSYIKDALKVIQSKMSDLAPSIIEEFGGFLDQLLGSKSQPGLECLIKAWEKPIPLTDSDTVWYSEKAGPNGQLSDNAHRDIITLHGAITLDGGNLYQAVLEMQNCIGQHTASSFRGSPDLDLEQFAPGVGHALVPGKITLIPEKSGKVRLVASPDYYSQVTLRPLHQWLMHVISAIPSDCTYDQGKAVPRLAQWQNEGSYVASFDQSSCTDLFPFEFQLAVIRKRFGDLFANRLRTVMVDRDWSLKTSSLDTVVRWSVGQPMGLYGSWPLMALSHHLLVQFANWRSMGSPSNVSWFSRYVICGDDIVIASRRVAREYLALVENLGMKINLAKSYISKRGSFPVSEFAKRLVAGGHEIKTIKPNMVARSLDHWEFAIPLFRSLIGDYPGVIRLKHLVRLTKEIFPSRYNLLGPLLTIPQDIGGVGLSDSRPLKGWYQSDRMDEIHPWIYYMASKVRSYFSLVARHKEPRMWRIIGEVGKAQFRQHPLYRYYQSLGSRYPWVHAFYGCSNVIEIARDLINGEDRGLNGLVQSVEQWEQISPLFASERDQLKMMRQDLEPWLKALSKPHYMREKAQPLTPAQEALNTFLYNGKDERVLQTERLVKLLTVVAGLKGYFNPEET